MSTIDDIIKQMRTSPGNIRFSDACQVAEAFFGNPRVAGSHYIYKVKWPGDPRVNLQKDEKNAKSYQIKQLLKAIERFKALNPDIKKRSG